MKKAILFGVTAMLLIGLVVSNVFAAPLGRSNKNANQTEEDPLITALENDDYDAYLEALSESDKPFMKRNLTEEEFHLRAAGFANMTAKREEMNKLRENITAAIEAEDYDTWYELVSSSEHESWVLEKITEDNFETYVELYKAKEKVSELSEELGLDNMKPEYFGNEHFGADHSGNMFNGNMTRPNGFGMDHRHRQINNADSVSE